MDSFLVTREKYFYFTNNSGGFSRFQEIRCRERVIAKFIRLEGNEKEKMGKVHFELYRGDKTG